MTFKPQGLLSAYSAALTGTTVQSLVLTGPASGTPLLTIATKILITNVTAETVYYTVDGNVPTTAGTNCFILPPVAGWQRWVILPAFSSQQAAEASAAVTLQAVGSSAWSIFVEAYA